MKEKKSKKLTTTIAIKIATKNRIMKNGIMGNDYDMVINRALDALEINKALDALKKKEEKEVR